MFCSRCGTEVHQDGKFCPSCGLDLGTMTVGGGAAVTPVEPTERSEFDIVSEALKGEYELIKELGRGGMAIVFSAREKQLDREVAVKVLPFSLAFDKDFVERFQREARTAAKLEHPNIIPIYRVGRSDKVIYFVMKFLRGESLSEVIKKRGALPPKEIRKLLAQSAHALHYAHKNGIVHRDIKPDNIMLDEMDHAVVTDFGIAKAASQTKLTGTGMSIGTPHYMSPEQARAQGLDGRSDIYSLGVVAYQCLTGHVPFDGDDSYSIGFKHVSEDIPVPPLRDAEQRELFEIIRRMMAKAPVDRFQDAQHLAKVLEGTSPIPSTPITTAPTVSMRAAHTSLTQAHRVTSSTTPTTPMPKTDMRPAVQPARKRGGALVGMFLLLLGGGAGAGGWYYLSNRQPASAAVHPDSVALAAADSTLHDSTRAVDSTTSEPKPAEPAEPVAMTGTLLVIGLPTGGRLQVDGRPVAIDSPVVVDPGLHRVTAQANSYEDYSTSVKVARGTQVPLTITMNKVAVGKPTGPRPAKASAGQCETPGETYNVNGACWDDRPVANSAPLVPIGDDIEGNPTPSIVVLLVSPEGTVQRITSKQISNNANFHLQALAFAKTLTFRPAQKDGQPVKAWVEVMLRPTRSH